MATEKYNVNSKVKWKWGNGWGHGKITESFTSKVTRQIDGNEVTRNASDDDPAYVIEQEDGGRVLKSHSEIQQD